MSSDQSKSREPLHKTSHKASRDAVREPAHEATPEPVADTQWTTRPERGSMFMLKLMTWISLRLGRPVARLVLHLITIYFLVFPGAARRASQDYLQRVLGRRPTLLDHYRHVFTFAATIHDRVYLINNRYDIFDIEVHNEQLVHDVLTEARGAFLIGAHVGSFEVIHAAGQRHRGLRTAMVMFEENARKLNAMLTAINPSLRQDIIALGRIDTMLTVRDRLEQGTVLSMLADRTLSSDTTMAAPFLGQTANFPTGPFRMAALLQRPVIFMVGLYLGGNRYSIYFERLADFTDTPAGERNAAIETAINRYAALLEHYCRLAPYNWFNFFDFWGTSTLAQKDTTDRL